LLVTEVLSNAQLSAVIGNGRDLSSCFFDEVTGRLLLMSHFGHSISDVGLDGMLHGQIELPQIQVEGFTFNHDCSQLVMVAEPNLYQIYHAQDVIFIDDFE
jgi:uncharacterized protein YjiK